MVATGECIHFSKVNVDSVQEMTNNRTVISPARHQINGARSIGQ